MQATRVVIVGDHCKAPYHVEIQCGRHALVADEPVKHGGLDSGPPPFGYLLSSLGACTAMALRAYCERRSWPNQRVMVTVELAGSIRSPVIDRVVHVLGVVTEAQRVRLAAVCERTPVTLVLARGIRITTHLFVQPLAP